MYGSDDRHLVEWLLEKGGPAVRYRAATELDGKGDVELLRRGLLESAVVRLWLDRLVVGRLRPTELHGSTATALENVLAKLAELGLRAGMAELDTRIEPLLPRLGELADYAFIIVPHLAWLGYGCVEPVRQYLCRMLAELARTAEAQIFDIHLPESELAGFPKAWAGKPILKPGLALPSIYHLYGLAHLPPELRDATVNRQIDAVIGYVLDPRLQALPYGYGYLWRKTERKVYSCGWSPHLPGYNGFEFKRDMFEAMLVPRVELMARFALAGSSNWFRSCLRHLEQFRTPAGAYRFPAGYLREGQNGYYVHGAHMGLEEQRAGQSLEIESTFRVLLIRRLAGS